MSAEQLVAVSHGADGVATLSMGTPGKASVITQEWGRQMQQALHEIAIRPEVRAVVLRSAGKSFCAGGDIAAIHQTLDDSDRQLGAIIDAFHGSILALRRLPVPVIGSVHGAAAGGGFSLALACDLLVAADNARFVVAYPALGTSSDGGLSHFLRQRLGAARALELVLASGALDAQQALALGLVAKVVELAQLDSETAAYAGRIAALPAQPVREFKRLIGGPEDAELEVQLAHEKQAFLRCAKTEDFRHRVTAFLQPRRA
jgi:2-(1,2-epoxy-1,2-dihydrophenyl)acetyl-CoA isomerase